ncbi:MarC family protein [Moorena producens]|uniref:MarC family protein n=1 Tax=Moorena producens TaxID=1155739 RepID=UPI003C712461
MGRLLRILGLAIASAYFASMLALASATATIPTLPSPSLARDFTGQTAIISAQAMESSRVQPAIPVKAEIDAKTQVLFEQLFEGFGGFNILIIFLLTVGPLKLIVPFVKLTANADPALRRQLALRGFGISTLVIFAVALLCQNVLKSWQIDLSAMLIATGIILFLVALRTVLSQYNPPTTKDATPVNPSLKLTINPLVFPSLLTPYGIAVVVTMSAMFGRMAIAPGSMFLLLLLVMVLNLGVMLVAHPLLNLIKPVTLRVLGFVFGVMQVALGLDMILTGVKLEAIALKFLLGL